MEPLILSGYGIHLNTSKRNLVITDRLNGIIKEYTPFQANFDTLIFNNTSASSITTSAIKWLAVNKINLYLLSWNGNLLSALLPREPNNGKLRIRAYEAHLKAERRYAIAEALIFEKLRQSHNLLVQLSKFYKGINKEEVDRLFKKEAEFYNTKTKDVPSLLVYEARIADYYFRCVGSAVFSQLYKDFTFVNRNNTLNSHCRRSADEYNSLLNYGYGVLEGIVRGMVTSVGLDATISYCHSIQTNRASLIFDIQELFRWLIDLSVIQLLEQKKLKKSSFWVTENMNLRLKSETATMLVTKIKENLNMKMPYKGMNFTYENILASEIKKLCSFILSDKDKLDFSSIPLVQIKRTDELPLREKIAGLTISDRKRLGIRRNTLWYQQKYIREGRKIKVYKKVMDKLVN